MYRTVVNKTLTAGKQVGFRFRRNGSGPTAGLRRLLGSELQTVGVDQQKRRIDNRRCYSGHVEQSVDGKTTLNVRNLYAGG